MSAHLADRLSFTDIVALAERDSGAYRRADEALLGRVGAVVDWINGNGPYTPDQVRAMTAQIRRLLATRLSLLLDRERYPDIAAERLDRPIFVIGFPRAGTTLIHSLLAEDPEVLAPQSWHVFSPSPPPGAGPVAPERFAYAQRQVEAWMDLCPAQKPMHPYIDKGAFQLCEDEEVLSMDFRVTYPYHYSQVVSMDAYQVIDAEPHASFRFHRELLQHLQWNTGRTRWACKGPSNQARLDGLFAAYPDALCVWPHRPMGEIYASIVALSMAVYDGICQRPLDWTGHARALAEGLKAGFDAMLDNALIDDPRVMHIPFRDITADPLGTVRRIYAKQGLDVSEAFEQRVEGWLADPANAVDRYGRYPYSYEELGVEREWVEALFADYSKRFGMD